MNLSLIPSFLTICGLSITAASLVFVFLTAGMRQDLIGIPRAILLRLGPLAIIFLLLTATLALLMLEAPLAAELRLGIVLSSLLFAVASLFSLALSYLRITLTLIHLDKIASLLDGWPLWTILLVPVGVLIWNYVNWGGLIVVSYSITGFSVGYAISLISLRKYLKYGFTRYMEALTATEWYERTLDFVCESRELYITATTPGFVLPSDFDPDKYPVAGQVRNPSRKSLFEIYLSCASVGTRIKYIFDLGETSNTIRAYHRLGIYQKYKEASEEIFQKVTSVGNIEIRYRSLDQRSEFRKASVIGDTGVAFSERGPFRKILHGEMVQDKPLASGLRSKFLQDEHWGNATELTKERLHILWETSINE